MHCDFNFYVEMISILQNIGKMVNTYIFCFAEYFFRSPLIYKTVKLIFLYLEGERSLILIDRLGDELVTVVKV